MKNKIILTTALVILLISSQNAKAAEFFSDGFESGNDTLVENNAKWAATSGDVSISTIEKRSGNYSMRFRYGASISRVEQRFDLGSQKEEVYIRYYVKFPTNYLHGSASPSNNKLIRLWSDDANYGSDMGKMGMSLGRNGSYSNAFPEAKKTWNSGWELSCSDAGMGDISAMPGMGKWYLTADQLGKWLAFEFHFKKDNGSGNGAFEFWVDGVKQFGSTTLSYGGAPCQAPYFKAGYLFGWANAPFAETTDIYVDDVVFSDNYIGTGTGTGTGDTTITDPPLLAPSNFRIVSN